jgi:hypothetical protein
VTVHDATFFTEPEHYDKSRRTVLPFGDQDVAASRERVIVPSKATRDELIRLLEADPTRIDVAYHGVDPIAFHRRRPRRRPEYERAWAWATAATWRSSARRSRARTCRI